MRCDSRACDTPARTLIECCRLARTLPAAAGVHSCAPIVTAMPRISEGHRSWLESFAAPTERSAFANRLRSVHRVAPPRGVGALPAVQAEHRHGHAARQRSRRGTPRHDRRHRLLHNRAHSSQRTRACAHLVRACFRSSSAHAHMPGARACVHVYAHVCLRVHTVWRATAGATRAERRFCTQPLIQSCNVPHTCVPAALRLRP